MTTDADDFDYRALFGGRYLTAANLPTEGRTLTIAAAGIEDIEDPKTKAVREKLVVYFQERGVKPWVPCRTTAGCLSAMWGAKTGGWRGRHVTLYQDPTVKVGAKVTGGIRVLGSPELDAPLDVAINLGARKPPAKVRLIPTGDPLAVALAELQATEAALASFLAGRPKPSTLPPATDRPGRARWAASLRSQPADADVIKAIRGTAPSPQPEPAPADEQGEE